MTIWVSSLYDAPAVAKRIKPHRAVSLLSPEDDFPALSLGDAAHHRVHLHDITEDMEGLISPARAHVEAIVRFLGDHRAEDTLLIHCWAGISRSTATAFIAACLHNPQTDERVIADALRTASPTAYPNSRIVGFADDILARRGRMTKAVAAMSEGVYADEAAPFSLPTRFA